MTRPTRRDVLKATGGTVLGTAVLAGSSGIGAAAPGDEVWSFEASGSVSTPTIVNGSVYVGSTAGDPTSYAYSVDAETGEQEWRYEPDGDQTNSVRFAMNVRDGQVFLGSNNVVALDAETGERNWKYEIGAIVSSPTAIGGSVYAASFANNLVSLDAQTGEEEWVFETPKPIESSPTIMDGSVYFGGSTTQASVLYSIDAETGEEEWTYDVGGLADSSPTLSDGVVYVGAGGSFDDTSHVYAVDAASGTEVWSYDTGTGGVYSSPTVYNGTVFVGDLSDDDDNGGIVYALDADNGEELWTFDAGEEIEPSPTVVEDTVFISTYEQDENFNTTGLVYALDATNGDELWRFEVEDETVDASVTVVDGVAFVGADDNMLYALETDVSGSSEDTRVNLGTLGHHNVWANKEPGSDEPFDVGVELEQEETVQVGGDTNVSVFINNRADESVSNVTAELMVDKNDDDQFVDSEVVAGQTVDLDANEYREVELTYEGVDLDPGEYTYRGRARKDGETTESFTDGTLTVNDVPFDVGVELEQEESVVQGSGVDISVFINNNSDQGLPGVTAELMVDKNDDDQFVDSEVVASQSVDLDANEYREVELTYESVDLDPGEYTYRGRARKDGETTESFTDGTLTVNDVPFDFTVELQQSASVAEGESVDITTTVTNNGQQSVSGATAELLVDENDDGQFVDSEVVASQSVDFGAGETKQLAMSYENVQLDADEYSTKARLSQGGDTAESSTGTLSVSELPPIVGTDPPQDLNGDGNFEDIDGSGELGVADVYAFMQNYDGQIVQDNPEKFNFSGQNENEVTLDDVLALYNSVL